MELRERSKPSNVQKGAPVFLLPTPEELGKGIVILFHKPKLKSLVKTKSKLKSGYTLCMFSAQPLVALALCRLNIFRNSLREDITLRGTERTTENEGIYLRILLNISALSLS